MREARLEGLDQKVIDFENALTQFKMAAEGSVKQDVYETLEGRLAFMMLLLSQSVLAEYPDSDDPFSSIKKTGKEILNKEDLSQIEGFILEDLINLLKRLDKSDKIIYQISPEHPGTVGDILTSIEDILKNSESLFNSLKSKPGVQEITKGTIMSVLGNSPYSITRAYGIRSILADQLLFMSKHSQPTQLTRGEMDELVKTTPIAA